MNKRQISNYEFFDFMSELYSWLLVLKGDTKKADETEANTSLCPFC